MARSLVRVNAYLHAETVTVPSVEVFHVHAASFAIKRTRIGVYAGSPRALANGQLEGILSMPVCQEVLDRDAPATRRRMRY